MDQLPRLGKRELICLLLFTCNYVVSVWMRFPLPLGAWDGLRYFIVALPEPSTNYFGKRYFLTGHSEKGYQFQNVEHTV